MGVFLFYFSFSLVTFLAPLRHYTKALLLCLLLPLKPPLDRLSDLLDDEDEDGKWDEEEPVSASAPGVRCGTKEPLEEEICKGEKPDTLKLMKAHQYIQHILLLCEVPEGGKRCLRNILRLRSQKRGMSL